MIYNKDKSMAIRAMEKSDLPVVQVWRNDDSIRRYFREYREFSLAQKEQWYESMIQNDKFEMFVIIDCEDQDIIGVTGLTVNTGLTTFPTIQRKNYTVASLRGLRSSGAIRVFGL